MSILIPFPHAAHNHQEKNARLLESSKAAEMILDAELNGEQLAQSIKNAMADEARLEDFEANSYRLGNREATKNVRKICLELIKETRGRIQEQQEINKSKLSCF